LQQTFLKDENMKIIELPVYDSEDVVFVNLKKIDFVRECMVNKSISCVISVSGVEFIIGMDLPSLMFHLNNKVPGVDVIYDYEPEKEE
jgi:hypothetical protein